MSDPVLPVDWYFHSPAVTPVEAEEVLEYPGGPAAVGCGAVGPEIRRPDDDDVDIDDDDSGNSVSSTRGMDITAL